MEKPITMVIEETKENIINVINESGLPFFILETMLRDLYSETVSLSRQQLENDKAQYNKAVQEEMQAKEIESAE